MCVSQLDVSYKAQIPGFSLLEQDLGICVVSESLDDSTQMRFESCCLTGVFSLSLCLLLAFSQYGVPGFPKKKSMVNTGLHGADLQYAIDL